MMEGWEEVKLKKVTKVINGFAFKSKDFSDFSEVPIVKIKSLKNQKIVIDESAKVSNTFLQLDKKYHINKGDILIALTGSHITMPASAVGRVAKSRLKETLLLNQRVGKFKVNEEICDHNFLFYYLITDYFFESIGLRARGASNQANISGGDVLDIKINLPSLKTQRKIASILSGYDDLIENNLKRIQLLEEQAQQTYEEWFVRFKFPGYENVEIDEVNGLPVGWDLKKLNEVSKINSKSLKKDFKGVIKYIDIASVSIGKIDSTTSYDFSEAPGRAKRIVQHGDIIWSCVRPNRKSHSVIWNPEDNLIASTGFCVISPKSLPTSYLLKYLTTDSFVAYLTNLAGGAAYPAVKAIDFKDANVVVPSRILLDKFDNKFRNVLEVSSNLQNQNQHLKEARDILLPRLMSGMIDVDGLEVDEQLGMVAEEREKYN